MHAQQLVDRERSSGPPQSIFITPADVEREYGIPETTQAVWRCTDRYGFRALVLKFGRSVRYKRSSVEQWIESRRASVLDAA